MVISKAACLIIILQVVALGLFAVFTKYERDTVAGDLQKSYTYFTDIHIMIFVGFGYLMTFLRRYGYSAVGFNMLLAALAIEIALLAQRLIESRFNPFEIKFYHLIEADVAAAAVLISFGAVIGRLDPLQLVVMTVLEVLIFAGNFHLGVHVYGALDAGGSIFVHTFGAYFGLAVSLVTYVKSHEQHPKNGPVYHSDIFSFLGTVFLWVCWPSFNAGLLTDAAGQYRAVLHTYLSLLASTLTAFAVSAAFDKKAAKFDMVHVQNATLAGGVAVGACANFMLQPYGALLLGTAAGALSVVGFRFITPTLASKARLLDTCGVHNLHGMPGLLSAIASIISLSLASYETYGARDYLLTFGGDGPNAAMQLAALGSTVAIAVVGGAVTGLIIRSKACGTPTVHEAYDDHKWWHLPSSEVNITGDDVEIGPLTHGDVTITRTVRTITTTKEGGTDNERLFT